MKKRIKNKKTWIIIGVVLIVLISIFAFNTNSENGTEVISVKKGDLVNTVKISGKVVPVKDASLGFQTGGTISNVYKEAGDTVLIGEVIAELDQSVLKAGLLRAKADLAAAQAELLKIQGNSSVDAKVVNTKNDAVQSIFDAYSDADIAIHSKADQLFKDGRTANPRMVYFFDDSDFEKYINYGRIEIETIFRKWREEISGLDASNFSNDKLVNSSNYLKSIASFLNDLAKAVNSFKETEGLSQATIDKFKSELVSARTMVNSSISNLITKTTTLSDVVSDVPVQIARVASAEAEVSNYQAQINNAIIYAPFS